MLTRMSITENFGDPDWAFIAVKNMLSEPFLLILLRPFNAC